MSLFTIYYQIIYNTVSLVKFEINMAIFGKNLYSLKSRMVQLYSTQKAFDIVYVAVSVLYFEFIPCAFQQYLNSTQHPCYLHEGILTDKNQSPAFSCCSSAQVNMEASRCVRFGKTSAMLVVLLRVESCIRKGTPS